MTTTPLSPQAAVNAWRHLEPGPHDGFTITTNDVDVTGYSVLNVRGRDIPTIMRVLDQALQHGRALEAEDEQLVEAKRAAEQGGQHLVHVPEIAGTFDVGPPTLEYRPGGGPEHVALRTIGRDPYGDDPQPSVRYWSVGFDGSLLELDEDGDPLLDPDGFEDGDPADLLEDLADEGVLGRVKSWACGAEDVLNVAIVEGEHEPFLKGYAAAIAALQRHLGEPA